MLVVATAANVVFALNVPAVVAPGAGIAGGQSLLDQSFQALARGMASPIDPAMLGSTFKYAFERIFASPLPRSQPISDTFDGLNLEEAGFDLDWQGMALAEHRVRRDGTAAPAVPTMVQHAAADPDALDHYFAQTADDPDAP